MRYRLRRLIFKLCFDTKLCYLFILSRQRARISNKIAHFTACYVARAPARALGAYTNTIARQFPRQIWFPPWRSGTGGRKVREKSNFTIVSTSVGNVERQWQREIKPRQEHDKDALKMYHIKRKLHFIVIMLSLIIHIFTSSLICLRSFHAAVSNPGRQRHKSYRKINAELSIRCESGDGNEKLHSRESFLKRIQKGVAMLWRKGWLGNDSWWEKLLRRFQKAFSVSFSESF
jgi:hypothetical protein